MHTVKLTQLLSWLSVVNICLIVIIGVILYTDYWEAENMDGQGHSVQRDPMQRDPAQRDPNRIVVPQIQDETTDLFLLH